MRYGRREFISLAVQKVSLKRQLFNTNVPIAYASLECLYLQFTSHPLRGYTESVKVLESYRVHRSL